MTLDTTPATVEANLRLTSVAVIEVGLAIEVDLASRAGALEVHLRLATRPDTRCALEVAHRRARPAADMRGVVVVPLIAIAGTGRGHREAEGHSGHDGSACG